MESFSLVNKLDLSKLCCKKVIGSKNPENGLFKKVSLSKKTYFVVLFKQTQFYEIITNLFTQSFMSASLAYLCPF